MAGEDEVEETDSVSLFLCCLLKENRFVTRTSGFGDKTGGLLILESENKNWGKMINMTKKKEPFFP